MKVTDIKIRKTFSEGSIKAIVSITIDNCLAVHDIKVVQGNGRIFAAMPKEPLINTFQPFFVTLSVTDFRVFLKTAKRTLRFNHRIPGRPDSNNVHRDIVHPISAESRNKLESIILKAYEDYTEILTQQQS